MSKKQIKLTLLIPLETIRKYNRLMQLKKLDYDRNSIPSYSTIKSWTVNAGDGYEIDVKVCSSDSGSPLWCEAVLFKFGSEVACTEIDETLDGEYEFEIDKLSLVLSVIRSE